MKSQKGAIALLLTVLILSIFLLIALGLSGLMTSQLKMSRETEYSGISYFAAETGIEKAIYDEYKGTGASPGSGTVGDGSYEIIINEGPPKIIQSIGTYKETKRSIEVTIPQSCGHTLVDSRDNKEYATIQIGSQCWMKQGLNVGTRINGSSGQGTDCSSASAIQKYCYGDSDYNCISDNPNSNYPDGALYQWNQAMCGSTSPGVQGICPTGWHIPTDAELCILEQTVDSTITCDSTGWRGTDGGTKLKPNGTSGFEGNLAGTRNADGSFSNRLYDGRFWSSSQNDPIYVWYRALDAGVAMVFRTMYYKDFGYSVRCLKD